MSARDSWNGRPVKYGEFTIWQGRAVREAFREDGETGSYTCLALSLRYADTDELVFASVDEINAQPFRHQQRLLYLAAEAAKANGMIEDDAQVADAMANGHAETVGPLN
jgi:hypothetical protein